MVMNRFTGDELTAMRETQVSSLMDRCVIEHYCETANAYNEMIRLTRMRRSGGAGWICALAVNGITISW